MSFIGIIFTKSYERKGKPTLIVQKENAPYGTSPELDGNIAPKMGA